MKYEYYLQFGKDIWCAPPRRTYKENKSKLLLVTNIPPNQILQEQSNVSWISKSQKLKQKNKF